jgi:hypothetical protein
LDTLQKLPQLNILSKVEIISTISGGGSIIGAYYVLNSERYKDFEDSLIN